jgi:hypothetical protein
MHMIGKSTRSSPMTAEEFRNSIRETMHEFIDGVHKQIGLNARVGMWLA